jgi:hypothetical protein
MTAVLVLLAACAAPSPTPFSTSATTPIPTPSPSPSASVRSVAVDGRFRLTLELPRATWSTSDAVTGVASLVLTGGPDAGLSGSSSLLNFQYAEIGGTRRRDPVWDAMCAHHGLSVTAPLVSDLRKSGSYPGAAPSGDFNREFLAGPQVRLPVGLWDITAIAMFAERGDCSDPSHEMRASVRVTIAH